MEYPPRGYQPALHVHQPAAKFCWSGSVSSPALGSSFRRGCKPSKLTTLFSHLLFFVQLSLLQVLGCKATQCQVFLLSV